jgi:beta-glucosidase
MSFAKDFVWGAATSSYQVEGAVQEDGRGECIWHRFTHTPGKVAGGATGDVACDHYHRYREDVALMSDLGLQGYRFSIAWARVLPQGTGATNPAGLDFYDRLVDELLCKNIQPFVTLYHWDLPQALQDRGGWENPDSIGWFREYVDLMSRRLGDRVGHWITHNEPWVIAFLGNYIGAHAPGKRDLPTAYKVGHHVLLSHGAAVPVIRANAPNAQVGITIDQVYIQPASQSPADVQAAYRVDGYRNRWFLDAVFKGQYTADVVPWVESALDGIDPTAVKQAAVPIDFLGINYYTRNLYAAAESGPFKSRPVPAPDRPRTANGWEIYSDGLRELLVRVSRDYRPQAIYITENGAAFDDPAPCQGIIEDPQRADYYRLHFDACAAAIEQGVPLKGYFAWSLLDNFEWAEGYRMRFGIVHVNFETLERTPKRSALAYRDWIARLKAGA